MPEQKKSAQEIRDEAAEAHQKVEEEKAEKLNKALVSPAEDKPRKREAWLKATYGDAVGAARFAEEKQAKKDLYPREGRVES